MSNTTGTPHKPQTQISDHPLIQKISRLEDDWNKSLQDASQSRRLLISHLDETQNAYKNLHAFIESLQFLQKTESSPIDRIISLYLTEIRDRQQQLRHVMIVHLDLYGQWRGIDPGKNQRQRKTYDRQIQQMDEAWKQLDTRSVVSGPLCELRQSKKHRDEFPKGSPAWRACNRHLLSHSGNLLKETINDATLAIKHSFERLLYRHTTLHQLGSKHTSMQEPENFSDKIRLQQITDWLHGYHPTTDFERKIEKQVQTAFLNPLSRKLRRRRLKQTCQIIALTLGLGMIVAVLQLTEVDNRVWDSFSQGFQKMMGWDVGSKRARERRKYFSDQIRTIQEDYSEKELLENLEIFRQISDENSQEKALYLAQNVLRGYFLLLTDWNTSTAFKEEVLTAIHKFDEDIHHHVHSLTVMFASDNMTQSHFQIHTLLLRRAFVNHDIFPFMFLSIYKNHPYVFLYPERIIEEYYFDHEEMEALGLNVAWYSHAANIPLVAHVVEGAVYPFKERAGYFEGQYSIVFNDVAQNAYWTALHEFGHSVDQMRFMFGQVPYPINVESHAMLFPTMFIEHPRHYFLNKIIGAVKVADPYDLYVQASKGVLNGYVQHQMERNPNLSLPIIRDNFNQKHIEEIRQWIAQYSDEQIRTIAIDIYRNASTYLTTAKSGTYRGHFNNAEEIIAGAHGPPTTSFIIDDFGDGEFTTGGSTRFIQDNQPAAPPPTDFWSFMKAVIHITLNPGASTERRDSLEAIVSSILIFLFVEGLLMWIQWMASPLRRRKYSGVLINDMVKKIYDNNPWSDGQSSGEAKGERELLTASYEAKAGPMDPDVIDQVSAFRTATDKKRKILFDICLTLAPWMPERSAVRTRRHNLLFWLPFLGPVMARWAWLMPRQRPFHQREEFNARIQDLCLSLNSGTPLEVFLQDYKQIVLDHQSSSSKERVEYQDDSSFLDDLEKQVHASINSADTRLTLNKPMIAQRSAQNYQEDVDFDRLEKYVFGDDIKRIDWRATARAVNNEPVIRKSASVYGLNVGFFLDFRGMNEHNRREQFAMDFVKSLRMLGKDRQLKELIFLMPNGEIFHKRTHLKLPVAAHARARILWTKVRTAFLESMKQGQQLDIPGLAFYSTTENEHYQQRYKLTDFPYRSTEGIAFEKLNVNNLNLFLIGMEPEKRHDITAYLPTTNQVFFW